MILVKVEQDSPHHVTPIVENHVVHVNAHMAQDIFYDGAYSVLPKGNEETTLRTQGMKMKDDVLVLQIPKYEVSNLSGGQTVYIGGEYIGQV